MMIQNKKGFTLIEFFVVIAILAILAVILVPSMVDYSNSAKEATANANARMVYSAASSAAAACIASGNTDDVASISTATSVSALKDNSFEEQIAEILGSAFQGVITVTVDTEGNVTDTTWAESTSGSLVGIYSVGGMLATP